MTTYQYHASPELSNANPDEGKVVDLQSRRPRRARRAAEEQPRFDESSVTAEMKLRLLAAISEDVDGNSVKVALLMLKYRNDRTGRCSPDRETLADDAECSVRTIAYCTKRLQDRKWIRIKHRRDNSNLYYFAWERLGVLDRLPHIVDALVAAKNQQDFERTWVERLGSSGDELDGYIRRIGKPGYIKGFVEELLTQYPKSSKKHHGYGRELTNIMNKLSPSQWALKTVFSRILMMDTKGFLPDFPDVVTLVVDQQQKLVRLIERRQKMREPQSSIEGIAP
jgi:hypothetical protein